MKRFLNYQWIKDNLAMILLVPTLLGGFWQVVELAYVGTPYIRFFSVTQLVSDGLLILFVLLLVYGITRMLLWDYLRKDKKEETDEKVVEPKIEIYRLDLDRKGKRKIIGMIVVNVLILAAFIYFYWGSLFSTVYYHDRLYTFEVPFLLFGLFIPVIFLGFILKGVISLWNVAWLIKHKSFGSVIGITSVILFFLTCYGLIKFVPWIHRSYLLAGDFKNTEYLGCKIQKTTRNLKSYQIEYFNDKYIFVELTFDKNKTQTEVFKFDEFFADTSCLNSKP